mgnify:CR=1 FL=1
MTEARKRSLLATSVFVGSVLGAGVFGLPYAFARAGWMIGFLYLVVIGGVLLVLQLINAEITIQTPGRRRLAGLAGVYLGPVGRYVTTFLFFCMNWGVLIAYTILAAGFLSEIFGSMFGSSILAYGLVFVAIEALLLLLPIKRAAHFELVIGGILLTLFLVLILSGLPFLQPGNWITFTPSEWLTPYGVALFALAGIGVMPEMHDVFGEKYEYRLPKAVIHGFFILFTLYAFFTLAVVGVNGSFTTENALEAYTIVLGPGMRAFGALLGLLTIGSIFFMVAEQVKDTLTFDFAFHRRAAWFVTLAVPTLLFVLGVRDFISVISFTGSVFVALLACVMLLIYERMRRGVCRRVKCFTVPRVVSIVIGLIFITGAIREIFIRFFL